MDESEIVWTTYRAGKSVSIIVTHIASGLSAHAESTSEIEARSMAWQDLERKVGGPKLCSNCKNPTKPGDGSSWCSMCVNEEA